MVKQIKTPCNSCPFRRSGGDRRACFRPEVLEDTVIRNMQTGHVHICHNHSEHMCAGFLAFMLRKRGDEWESHYLLSRGIEWGVIDPEGIDREVDIFDDVPEMLNDHARRSLVSVPAHTQEKNE